MMVQTRATSCADAFNEPVSGLLRQPMGPLHSKSSHKNNLIS
jgi:hypothetical protein